MIGALVPFIDASERGPSLQTEGASALDFVDPFIGTGGFGFGAVGINPGAQLPFGTLRLGPDTSSKVLGDDEELEFNHYGGYHFDDEFVRGFGHLHMVGAGVGDLGNFGIMPVAVSEENYERDLGKLVSPSKRTARQRKDSEAASPGFYSATLELRPLSGLSCKAEVTATGSHSGFHRYTFDGVSKSRVGLALDVCHFASGASAKYRRGACGSPEVNATLSDDGSEVHLSAYVQMKGSLTSRSDRGGLDLFFAATVRAINGNVPDARLWVNGSLASNGTSAAAGGDSGSLGVFVVAAAGATSLEVVAGVSYISASAATRAVQRSASRYASFPEASAGAEQVWLEQMDRVVLDGIVTKQDRDAASKFYTNLFHAFLAPSQYSDEEGGYLGMDGQARRVGDRDEDQRSHAYTDMSLWDIHRTQLPLLSLIDPGVFEDIIASLEDMLITGGDVPRWPLANIYSGCMIGSHGFASITEAVLKGHSGFNATRLYGAMRSTATTNRTHAGRSHLDSYLNLGFVPHEDARTSASLTLSYAFDDASVAAVADALGLDEEAAAFANRSKRAYESQFSSKRLLMCPRSRDGTLKCPEVPWTPYPVETDFVEGSALQWAWFVPSDPAGLAALFPSNESFVQKLDAFFADSRPVSEGGKWPGGTTLANGWYWAGNEPDLLTAFQFPFAGAQSRTARWSRYLVNEAYTLKPDGVPGNDDYGTMSAWFVWASLGLYPMAGQTKFVVGSPRFSARIPERNLRIVVTNASDENAFVQSAKLNGSPLPEPFLTFQQLASGNATGVETLVEFVMGPEPNLDLWG